MSFSAFDAFCIIAAQVHSQLHPARYRCKLIYEDCHEMPIALLAIEPLVDMAFIAQSIPDPAELAALTCPGHIERYAATIAHGLQKQLDDHAAALYGHGRNRERGRKGKRVMSKVIAKRSR